jgi:SAM-dependent methyltransferase
MNNLKPSDCRLCGGTNLSSVFTYDAPPRGEIRFAFASSGPYRREIYRCVRCGHLVSVHTMDDQALYTGDYVSANYGDDGIRRAFDRIKTLEPALSDNVGRVRRIVEYVAAQDAGPERERRRPSVLDVGSGLCVFLDRMKAVGWHGTALDPDARAVRHAREYVGVDAVCGDFMTVDPFGPFDLLSFNKVLEHVRDPVAMLARSHFFLRAGGFVYVEVPDGEEASAHGPEREEFAIDHPHIFSATSLTLLATRAGFTVRRLERLREPSMKYTLFAFLAKREEKP